MKKLFFFSLAVSAFGMMSCKKCQTCTVTTNQTAQGITQQISQTSNDYCGDEYNNAPSEGTTSQDYGGYSQSVVIACQDK